MADLPALRQQRLILLASPAAQLVMLIMLGVLLRLIWASNTHFIYEDAFITFRFAHNLAAGRGFVHNLGERVYGTTTPLLTLLLAGWQMAFPGHIIVGTQLLGFASAIMTQAILWDGLGRAGITDARRWLALALLVIPNKLWVRDMGGMETPLVIALMIATGWAVLRGWPIRAGALAGLLLWTRIDAVFWVMAMSMVLGLAERRLPWQFTVAAGMTYLPWVLFATFYFGSPIPHTIIAKELSYTVTNFQPLSHHLSVAWNFLAPFYIPPEWGRFWQIGLATLTSLCAAWGAVQLRRIAVLNVLTVFWVIEITRVTITRATFEGRYLIPLLVITLILAGLGLGALWKSLSRVGPLWRWGGALGLALVLAVSLGISYREAEFYRRSQSYRNEASLKAMGVWLNQNTPANATVLLEPLGYVGYYADRHMIDVVGLVTPQIIELKRQGIQDELQFIQHLQPDYVVVHCDDVLLWNGPDRPALDFSHRYSKVNVFNPLHFDPYAPAAAFDARAACYELWGRSTG
jgi:hypothetical protein